MSRGMTEDEAMAAIVRGFVEPIARELPMEYALELNRLIGCGWRGRSADVGWTSGGDRVHSVSRLHEHRCYDPADFAVPPAARSSDGPRRCAGCAGCTRTTREHSGQVTVDVDPASEVKISTAERSGSLPARSYPGRPGERRAYASFDEATVITVPAEAGRVTAHRRHRDG